jgi:hypothetical protein
MRGKRATLRLVEVLHSSLRRVRVLGWTGGGLCLVLMVLKGDGVGRRRQQRSGACRLSLAPRPYDFPTTWNVSLLSCRRRRTP